MDEALVEVRIPTYKRPDWLSHALRSLISQDFTNWKAIIFDDSPEREAQDVVRQFNDPRLIYRPNERNFGAWRNLNQSFRNTAFVGGKYACILEDDNWFLPDFISSNVEIMESTSINIVHRNQEVWSRVGGGMKKGEYTTLSHRYYREYMTPVHLHAHTFFWAGVSNGAIFFRIGMRTNLEVNSPETDPSLQEYLRCAAIREDSIFLAEPKAVFAYVPIADTARHYADPKYFSAYIRELLRRIINHYGREVVAEAIDIQDHMYPRNMSRVSQMLANSNKLPAFEYLSKPELVRYWATGIIKSSFYRSKVNSNLRWI